MVHQLLILDVPVPRNRVDSRIKASGDRLYIDHLHTKLGGLQYYLQVQGTIYDIKVENLTGE